MEGALAVSMRPFRPGFKRSIEGYPRYTMVGQRPNEHHLMIKNVSRRDTDEYQCQATPGRADQRRLVASAFLTVLGEARWWLCVSIGYAHCHQAHMLRFRSVPCLCGIPVL